MVSQYYQGHRKPSGQKRPDPGECWKCGRLWKWRVRKLCGHCRKLCLAADQGKMVVGGPDFPWEAPPPAGPCPHPPGSPEKVAVMRERAERKEQLFHEGDGI